MSDVRPQTPDHLVFVGAGQMAEAIFSRLISQKIIHPGKIIISDINKERLVYLQEKYSVKATSSNAEALIGSNAVILAVKPQHMAGVLDELSQKDANRLIISIAAGIKTSFIEKKMPQARVVRVMPNAAAFVGQAVTAISAGPKATETDIEVVEKIFGSVGRVVKIEEALQDAVTAVSGSGPAYFFYLTEALIKAGLQAELNEQQSRLLATQTAIGAGKLLKTGKAPEYLRKAVTSPGGTTEAAINSLEQNDFFDIVKKAVQSAKKRASELSGEFK